MELSTRTITNIVVLFLFFVAFYYIYSTNHSRIRSSQDAGMRMDHMDQKVDDGNHRIGTLEERIDKLETPPAGDKADEAPPEFKVDGYSASGDVYAPYISN